MAPGVSCNEGTWNQNGKQLPLVKFGDETYVGAASHDSTCRDCNTPRGYSHHYECVVEQCPHGQQALMCDECPPLAYDPFAPPVH